MITTLSYVTSQLSTKDLFDIPIFLKYASTIIISAGLYAIFISLFGFCGAMMRMKYLLYVYALILFASLLLQVRLVRVFTLVCGAGHVSQGVIT